MFLNHGRRLHTLALFWFTADRAIHNQVNQFAHFSPSILMRFQSSFNCNSPNGRLYFSSMPESILEVFSLSDWPQRLDDEVQDSKLTHEAVIYVLTKLSKEPNKASGFFKWAVEKNGFEPSPSIYSLVLRIYANKDSSIEFWVTIKEMKDRGYFIDEGTYKIIYSIFRGLKMESDATALRDFYSRLVKETVIEDRAKEVVDLIKNAEWGGEVESKLQEMKLVVSDNFMLRVLTELGGKGYPQKAYRFFKWVDNSLGFNHNSVTYNGALRVLCLEESINEFWSVLEEMKTVCCEMDFYTYIKISRRLQKNKMIADSVKLYEHMMDRSYKPSDYDFNFLLHSLARYDRLDLDLINRVVNKFDTAGYSYSKKIYDGIHRSLTCLCKFDEAEKIVEKMRNAGYKPDNITYSQLVFGLCKARKFDEAFKVLDLMEEQGCSPNMVTWSVLIKGHCDANQTEKALLCFAKMVEKGFDADADLLDVLVNGFLHQSSPVSAFQLLVELAQKSRLRPWQSTYRNLIEKLLTDRKLEEAMELLGAMKKHNYPPFAEPFVHYISKYGSVEDALEFLKALTVKEYPTVSAYRHVFKSFFDEGRYSEAKDLLFKCPHHIRKHPVVCSFFRSAT